MNRWNLPVTANIIWLAFPMVWNAVLLKLRNFLNVVFGNSSLQPHIWVVDIDLAPSLIDCFKGPRFGLNGIRELVKTPKRAMIQAVIKPMGISPAQLADMCKAMCRVEPM